MKSYHLLKPLAKVLFARFIRRVAFVYDRVARKAGFLSAGDYRIYDCITPNLAKGCW